LQAAFLAVHRDPRFLEEAEKLGIDISPVDSTQLVRSIEQLAEAPPHIFGYLKELLMRH
jgi:hypothetical protein